MSQSSTVNMASDCEILYPYFLVSIAQSRRASAVCDLLSATENSYHINDIIASFLASPARCFGSIHIHVIVRHGHQSVIDAKVGGPK